MLSSIFEPCCIRTAELYAFNCEGKWQQHPKPAPIQVILGPVSIPKLHVVGCCIVYDFDRNCCLVDILTGSSIHLCMYQFTPC